MEGWLSMRHARSPQGNARRHRIAAFAWALLLSCAALLSAAPGPVAAYPGEPTVEVTVVPNDVTVDASGFNPVDTSFTVNVTGSNSFPQARTMWVNISFQTSTGWKVNPTVANLTFSLAAGGASPGTQKETLSVTVTVPPKVSANNGSVFSAAYRQANSMRFSQGQSGNATAQIDIRQIFSTSAEFVNGTEQATVRQGQDTNLSIQVTNRGNGDGAYDAELRNAAELRPSDILLKSTTAATVPQNGTGIVRLVIHANPYAIAGTYQLQVRVLAAGSGTPPPAGAFADLTAQLTVTAAAPPPSQNNTTTPPPPSGNNTTVPPPPPPSNPDFIAVFLGVATSPGGIVGISILAAVVIIGAYVLRRNARAKRQRAEALERARGRMQGGPPARPGGPVRPSAVGPRPGGPGGALAPPPGSPPPARRVVARAGPQPPGVRAPPRP